MPINEKQKYPDDKKEYDRNYLRIYGKVCPDCKGLGIVNGDGMAYKCIKCGSVGYIPKEKK